jgi:hypothetical protein
MMILPIDDDHIDGSAAERLRGFEATEACAHDDDPRTLLRHAVYVRVIHCIGAASLPPSQPHLGHVAGRAGSPSDTAPKYLIRDNDRASGYIRAVMGVRKSV